MTGDEKACLINQKCDTSYGELHFKDNEGYNHILIRGKHRFDNKKNFISLDGKSITQADLIKFFNDKKLFLSIFNPLYFLNKKPSEQKELIDKYLSKVKTSEIFEMLDKTEQDILIKRYYKDTKPFSDLTKQEQADFINYHILNIFMDIAYDKLDIKEQQTLEEIPDNIPNFITDLNDTIKSAEKKIILLNGRIEYAQNTTDEKLEDYMKFDKDVELSLARQELAFLTTNQDIIDKENQKHKVDTLEEDILNKETEIVELEKRMREGKKRYLEIKNGTIKECPTCGQHIQNVSQIETIKNMKDSLTADFERKNLLDTQKKDLSYKLMIEKCKYHSLEGETTIEKSKQIDVIQEKIKELENEQLQIEKHNNEIRIKENNIKNAKLDIEKFRNDIALHNEIINNTNKVKKIAQKLYITYIEEKMKLAKQYLKDVDIKFYSVLKSTGEIKDDFIITYKGTPLSDLSKSETIATAIEFANMFNQIAKTKFPIFIDDVESCADYNFIEDYSDNAQLILSNVVKKSPLTISNYNNSSEYTIIKKSIKRFRTMNIQQNNVAELQKAA